MEAAERVERVDSNTVIAKDFRVSVPSVQRTPEGRTDT